ncbi:MAG: flagellar biosynthetic protein FliR [Lachnospiraceae bacterium]|nr:flagellar biosynthetic protein FliR [Lachnospiraceae bacterium]
MIFVRMASFTVTAPFFSMTNVPRRAKAGIAFFISVLVYSTLSPHEAIEYSSIISFAIIVLKEAISGILIGFGANICLSITSLAGKIADMEMGLSMVQMFDPMTRDQTGFMGSIYQYGVILILLVTNMHHYILRAFIETYTLIPIGQVKFNSEIVIDSVTKFLVDYVSIGFRFCLPVVAAIMLLNALLGVLAKTSPQMNMFAVGIQLKIFVGFAVIIFTIGLLPSVSEFLYREMDAMMQMVIKSMI